MDRMECYFEQECNEFEELAKIEIIEDKNFCNDDVKVSVWCVTFNHKDYIKNVIEGFIKQKTNFRFDVHIFDDASTDGTSEIIKEFAEKYPQLIKAYLAHVNTYTHPERKKLITEFMREKIRGKYTALCEGDDYWIYDQKLQKQYNWMESHPHISLCIHNAIRYNEEVKELVPQIFDMDSGYMEAEVLFLCNHGRFPTASYFYRTKYKNEIPSFYFSCPVADEPLRWWLAYKGDVYYMDKVWSVRNYMHEGSWNQSMATDIIFKQNTIRRYVQSLFEADKETDYRFHAYIERLAFEQCRCDVFSNLSDEFKYIELNNRVRDCKKNNCIEASPYYERVFLLELNRCTDYLDLVFYLAKENISKFYIYGAGIEAKKNAQILMDNNIEFEGFVVSKKDGLQMELMNHTVMEFSEVEHKETSYFWLCMNYQNRIEVINKLLEEKVSKII